MHANMICDRANSKVGAITRLRFKLNIGQKILLYSSFILGQFGYCTNVWAFHGKKVQERINSIQKRSLRAVYNDFSLDLPQLLLKGNHATVHVNNIRRLIVQMLKL